MNKQVFESPDRPWEEIEILEWQKKNDEDSNTKQSYDYKIAVCWRSHHTQNASNQPYIIAQSIRSVWMRHKFIAILSGLYVYLFLNFSSTILLYGIERERWTFWGIFFVRVVVVALYTIWVIINEANSKQKKIVHSHTFAIIWCDEWESAEREKIAKI